MRAKRRCDDVKCPLVLQQKPCPTDSMLVKEEKSDNDCCPAQSYCKCDELACTAKTINCGRNEKRVLIRNGDRNKPGECCDVYECQTIEIALDCSAVQCPNEDFINEGCPEDSYRPEPYIPQGQCCPITDRCHCKPGICRPVICPRSTDDIHLTSGGTGMPGACCPVFQCAPSKNNASHVASADEKMMNTAPHLLNVFVNTEIEEKEPVLNKNDLPIVKKTNCYFESEAKFYENHQKWYPTPCTQCHCDNGLVFCKSMRCAKPKEQCSWIERPPGECCPVCMGCKIDEHNLLLNETWQKDDCTTCTCTASGELHCTKQVCTRRCENPHKIPGICCPVCDEETVITESPICASVAKCPLRCLNGLAKDERDCYTCNCAHDKIESGKRTHNCTPLTERNCHKQCAHGYKIDDATKCSLCECRECPLMALCEKTCIYGFVVNDRNDCPLCKCRGEPPAEMPSKEKSPTELAWSEARCYDVAAGKQHSSGEWWFDGCRQCYCEAGVEYCSLIQCDAFDQSQCSRDDWITDSVNCCPHCREKGSGVSSVFSAQTLFDDEPWSNDVMLRPVPTSCRDDSKFRLYFDGETWTQSSCRECTCRLGHVMCSVKHCPPTPCQQPVRKENECCLSCQEPRHRIEPHSPDNDSAVCKTEDGIALQLGAVWRRDACTSCVCAEYNQMQCHTQQCPNEIKCNQSSLTVKAECCPMCEEELITGLNCVYNNVAYSPGEKWADGPCKNCTCRDDGQTSCVGVQCLPCQPEHTMIYESNQCCAICVPPPTITHVYPVDFNQSTPGDVQISTNQNKPVGFNSLTIPIFCSIIGVIVFILVAVLVIVAWKCKEKRKKRTIGAKRGRRCKSPPPAYTQESQPLKVDENHSDRSWSRNTALNAC